MKCVATPARATLRQTFKLALVFHFLSNVLLAAGSFPEVSQLASNPGAPDPLVKLNGERVTTKEQWFAQRRPELEGVVPTLHVRRHAARAGA